jgi:hypothetical protein
MTYAELVQKIRDYTEVDSNVLTSTIVDGIINDAEFRIFRDIDSDNNRRYATANLITSDRFIEIQVICQSIILLELQEFLNITVCGMSKK